MESSTRQSLKYNILLVANFAAGEADAHPASLVKPIWLYIYIEVKRH